jgi:hypothetical protein
VVLGRNDYFGGVKLINANFGRYIMKEVTNIKDYRKEKAVDGSEGSDSVEVVVEIMDQNGLDERFLELVAFDTRDLTQKHFPGEIMFWYEYFEGAYYTGPSRGGYSSVLVLEKKDIGIGARAIELSEFEKILSKRKPVESPKCKVYEF